MLRNVAVQTAVTLHNVATTCHTVMTMVRTLASKLCEVMACTQVYPCHNFPTHCKADMQTWIHPFDPHRVCGVERVADSVHVCCMKPLKDLREA